MEVLTQRKSYHVERSLFRTRDVQVDKIKCAFFDLDGTLVPLIPSYVLSKQAVELARTLEPDKRKALAEAYRQLTAEWDGQPVHGDFSTGRLTQIPTATTQVIEDGGVLFKLAFIRAGMEGIEGDRILHRARVGIMREHGVLIEGVNEELPMLIERLHHAKKFVVTNSPKETAEETLKMLGIREAIAEVYASCRKPAGLRQLLPMILEMEGIEPKDAFYVGDNYGIEILIARDMGIPVAYISRRASEEMLSNFAEGKSKPPLIIVPTIDTLAKYAK